jgi:hypothetical protein
MVKEIVLAGPSPSGKTTLGNLYLGYLINCLIAEPSDIMNASIIIHAPTNDWADRRRQIVLERFSYVNFKLHSKTHPIQLTRNLNIIASGSKTNNNLGINPIACITEVPSTDKEHDNLRARVLSRGGIMIYDRWEKDTKFATLMKVSARYNPSIWVYEGKLHESN